MLIACDVETTSLDFIGCELLGFGYWSPGHKGYLTDINQIIEWFSLHETDTFAWQNGKFDQKVIKKKCGIWVRNDFDTLLAASLLPDKPESLALDSLVSHYLGYPSWKDKDFITNLQYKTKEEQAEYCLTDTEHTHRLVQLFLNKLNECGNLYFFSKYLMKISDMLARVEYTGITTNKELLYSLQKRVLKELEQKDKELYEKVKPLVAELEDEKIDKFYKKSPNSKQTREQLREKPLYRFNFSAPKQRLWLLRDKLKFPCSKVEWKAGRKHTVFSAAKPIIQEYEGKHEVVDGILEIENLVSEDESVSRFIEFTREDGKIHTTFNLFRADTGRTSSSDPPMQNVNRGELRNAFVASPGKVLVVADESQIEFRTAAHFTQDEVLLKAFNSHIDVYGTIANQVMGTDYDPNTLKKEHPQYRDFGKVTGLSVQYGIGPDKYAAEVRKKVKISCTYKEAKQHIANYFDRFKGLFAGRAAAYKEILENGYIDTLFGRRIFLSQQEGQHKAFNYKNQPSASDLLLITCLWVYDEQEKFGFNAELLLVVHDECVWEIEESKAEAFAQLLRTVMTHGWKKYAPEIKFSIPLECSIDIGKTWGCKS